MDGLQPVTTTLLFPNELAAGDDNPMKFADRPVMPFVEALSIVTLWSATPPLAKIVMEHLPPLEFLGLRYSIAFLALLPILWKRSWPVLRKLPASAWMKLILMGIITYPLANGLQFWALTRLTATTGTFTMNFVPVFTLALGAIWLAERPVRLQWLGVVMALGGAAVFFGFDIKLDDFQAILASTLGSLLLAVNAVIGRSFARTGQVDSFSLAGIPLGIGGLVLITFAPPSLDQPAQVIGIVVFLGVVSGALAFTVWYHALKGLQAFEITIIGNLMPMGTAILAPLILGEVVSSQAWIGILIALVGVVLVGIRAGSSKQAVWNVNLSSRKGE